MGSNNNSQRSKKTHILFIDNFDSFVFNLVDALSCLGAEIDVCRNDIGADRAMEIAEEKDSSMILLSPGPGAPEKAGCTIELIKKAAGRYPLFGVCLGHQALAEAFGGRVGRAESIVHGKKTHIRHNGHGMFEGLPETFEVGRYHSLIAHDLPGELVATATAGNMVMAMAHRTLPVYGVQFHPESVLTTHGQKFLSNILHMATNHNQPSMVSEA